MIELTYLNGTPFVLNSNLIETVESIPESKITLTTGKYFLVLESKSEIVERVVTYNQRIFSNRIVSQKQVKGKT